MGIDTILLISATLIILAWSLKKDRDKTVLGLKIAKGRFIDMAGEIIGILALVGLFFSIVPHNMITSTLGGTDPILSAFLGAAIGAVTIIPAFVAFP
ncbi:MAG: permease, partial [Thermoplasmata archaeon]|nr:permease [Thermoplasmata archaeon]